MTENIATRTRAKVGQMVNDIETGRNAELFPETSASTKLAAQLSAKMSVSSDEFLDADAPESSKVTDDDGDPVMTTKNVTMSRDERKSCMEFAKNFLHTGLTFYELKGLDYTNAYIEKFNEQMTFFSIRSVPGRLFCFKACMKPDVLEKITEFYRPKPFDMGDMIQWFATHYTTLGYLLTEMLELFDDKFMGRTIDELDAYARKKRNQYASLMALDDTTREVLLFVRGLQGSPYMDTAVRLIQNPMYNSMRKLLVGLRTQAALMPAAPSQPT